MTPRKCRREGEECAIDCHFATHGDASAEDEMYEVEEQLDKANAILKKEKEVMVRFLWITRCLP